jgi:acyl-CoA thioester hydrolase
MARFFESIHGVYFDDLDPFEILHNARYLLLFERTIGQFWERMGWGGTLDAQHNPDQYHLVRANHVEYHRPVRGVGQVRVRLTVAKLGRSSLTFAFRVMPMDQDVDYASGTRVLVRVDPETRKSAPWSDTFRRQLTPYLEAGAAGAGEARGS